MKKRIMKKSEVLREGYVKGLRKAQSIINETLAQTQGSDANEKLFKSACDGNRRELMEALKAGADVNAKDVVLYTALHFAARENYMLIALILLERGADIEAKTNYGRTPLHEAVYYGSTEVCELLLEYGADVNAKDKKDFTPLHLAVGEGYDWLVELLLEHGADVNAKDFKGNTAYDYALEDDDLQDCRSLLEQYM